MHKKLINELCKNTPTLKENAREWNNNNEHKAGATAIAEALNSENTYKAEIFEDEKYPEFALVALYQEKISLKQFSSICLYWSAQKDYENKHYDIDYYTLPTSTKKTTTASHKFRQFLSPLEAILSIPMGEEDFNAVIEALSNDDIPESERRFSVMYFEDNSEIPPLLLNIATFKLFTPRETKNGYELIIPSHSMVQAVLDVLKPGQIKLVPKLGVLSGLDVFDCHVNKQHTFGLSFPGFENFIADKQKSLRLGFALHDIYHAVILAHVPIRKAFHEMITIGQQFIENNPNSLGEDLAITQFLNLLIDQEFVDYFLIARVEKLGIDLALTKFKSICNPEALFIECLLGAFLPHINDQITQLDNLEKIKPIQNKVFVFLLANIINNHEKWDTEHGINVTKLIDLICQAKNPLDSVEARDEAGKLSRKFYKHLKQTTEELLTAAKNSDADYHKCFNKKGVAWCENYESNVKEEIKEDSENDIFESEEDEIAALIAAVKKGDVKTVNRLLDSELDINMMKATDNFFPDLPIRDLIDSINENTWKDEKFVACFKALVNAGLNFKLPVIGQNHEPITTLWGRLQLKKVGMPVKIRQFCIENGAAINGLSSDRDGGLAELHYAVKKGNRDYIKFLSEHSADINVRSIKGKTPLDLFEYRVWEDKEGIKTLLESYGAETSELAKERPKKTVTKSNFLTDSYSDSELYFETDSETDSDTVFDHEKLGFFSKPQKSKDPRKRKEKYHDTDSRTEANRKCISLINEYTNTLKATNGLQRVMCEQAKMYSMNAKAYFTKVNALDMNTKTELCTLPLYIVFLYDLANKDEDDMLEFVDTTIDRLIKEQKEMLLNEKSASALKKLDAYFDSKSIQLCFIKLIEKTREMKKDLEKCEDKIALVDKNFTDMIQILPTLFQPLFVSISTSTKANEDVQKLTALEVKLFPLLMKNVENLEVNEKLSQLKLMMSKNVIFKSLKMAEQGYFNFKHFLELFESLGVINEEVISNINNNITLGLKISFENWIEILYNDTKENFFEVFLSYHKGDTSDDFLERSIECLLKNAYDDTEIRESAQAYIDNEGEFAGILAKIMEKSGDLRAGQDNKSN